MPNSQESKFSLCVQCISNGSCDSFMWVTSVKRVHHVGQGKVRQLQYNSKLQRKWTPKIYKYILAEHGSTESQLSTTETQHTLTTMRNH